MHGKTALNNVRQGGKSTDFAARRYDVAAPQFSHLYPLIVSYMTLQMPICPIVVMLACRKIPIPPTISQ